LVHGNSFPIVNIHRATTFFNRIKGQILANTKLAFPKLADAENHLSGLLFFARLWYSIIIGLHAES